MGLASIDPALALSCYHTGDRLVIALCGYLWIAIVRIKCYSYMKPLTRTVYEARQLRLAAQRVGVATQMGNQRHSGVGYRMVVELIPDSQLC